MKTKVRDEPEDYRTPYSHLAPVVDFLLKNGNSSAHDFIWGVNRTGYFCHLSKPIDFELLLGNFEFPDTILINRKEQLIDFLKTYTVIRHL